MQLVPIVLIPKSSDLGATVHSDPNLDHLASSQQMGQESSKVPIPDCSTHGHTFIPSPSEVSAMQPWLMGHFRTADLPLAWSSRQ